MKSAVIVFPGSNRERDLSLALEKASGHKSVMVWHGDTALPKDIDLVALPGGFSYGDYLRCGAIAARANIMDPVREHAKRGGYVLGVCNGFQILCESGLLPGVLQRNAKLHFICRDVHLRVERNDTAFTSAYQKGDVIKVPVAHGEGNYTADAETLKKLESDNRILFRYVNANGETDERSNINGASLSIAGITSENGRVLGMMPHPENAIEMPQGSTGGLGMFQSLQNTRKAA
ncbi:MAG: phosphoribosylformylglycinamidine synthase subunit PurQ [Pseudomonadota bacterium]